MDPTPKPPAYAVYQRLADAYAAKIDTKPHNAYYERPATLSLIGDVDGLRVLDAGCGPGVYAQALSAAGARVTACDLSE
ncbi:MAG: methyltransferase domain-containing protein, partial [Acidobacteriota bacterium]